MVPDTSVHVTRMAAPVIGLDPTFPVIAEAYTSVTPVFDRIANVPALARFTGACGCDATALVVAAQASAAINRAMERFSGLNELLSVVIIVPLS